MAKPRTIPRLVALATGVSLLLASPAQAANLGNVGRTPAAACPKSPCEAVGSVTGIQVKANGKQAPFKAREDGKLVAWAVDPSRPNKEQRAFFGEFFESNQFGLAPTARIAVVKRKDGRDHKLKGQSPVVDLSSVLGHYQVFTLADPLRIRKGEFLAITVPTWVSSFAVGLSQRKNSWRASRPNGQCDGEQDLRNGKPQQKVGSERPYECDYPGARLLYWGFYEPKRDR